MLGKFCGCACGVCVFLHILHKENEDLSGVIANQNGFLAFHYLLSLVKKEITFILFKSHCRKRVENLIGSHTLHSEFSVHGVFLSITQLAAC